MIDRSEMNNPTVAAAIDNSTGLVSSESGNSSVANDSIMENSTGDITDEPWLRGIVIPFYVIIFILGITGNTIVVFVVARNKSMQTITNIFITNLALSDIMMCLMAVPFTPLAAFMGDWIFGDTICHILPMALAVSVFVSTLTSTAIAIDRYFVIVYPFKPRMKVWICLLLIFFIWMISTSISMPLAIYQRVEYNAAKNIQFCGEKWPDTQSRKFFTYTIFILQYVAPCTVIIFCYHEVSRVLKERSRAKIGSGSKSREKEILEIKRKRRTNKMLIAMVVIFMVCWMPLNVVHLLSENITSVQHWYWFTLVFFIAHIIAMSSTIYNPFLYAWMNDNFRKEFKTILPCLFVLRPRSNINGSTQYSTVDTAVTNVERSPMRERNGSNSGSGKSAHAHYDLDSEKVHLKVTADHEDV
ncbi:prolactin-releasing peptide receptor-like [Tubulanus polymorphus]|uniref:prolactin-releasing peptide receptor-like n=1 Tax=Tubulanus polymorphus TaxID=672921 RepID=UPI003DA413D4